VQLTRTEKREILFLLTFFLILYSLGLNVLLHPTSDSARYLTAAKAIWETGKFTYTEMPVINFRPGLSLLIAPIYGLFGFNIVLIRLMIILHLLGGLFICYLFFREEEVSHPTALCIIGAMGISFATLFETMRILTELPYFFYSFLALYAFQRFLKNQKGLRDPWGWVFALSTSYAFLLRPVGLILVGVFFFYLVIHAKRLDWRLFVAPFIIILLVVGSWYAWTFWAITKLPDFLLAISADYPKTFLRRSALSHDTIESWVEVLIRLKENIFYYAYLAGNLLLGRILDKGRWFVSLPSALLLFLPWLFSFFQKRKATDWYLIFYFSILLLWPWRQDERFLVPILPLIFAPLITWLIRIVPTQKKRLFALLLLIAIVGLNMPQNIQTIERERRVPYYDKALSDFLNVASWIRKNTAPDAIIVGDVAAWIFLFGQRHPFYFPLTSDKDRLDRHLKESKADYLLWTELEFASTKYLSPYILNQKKRFVPVFQQGRTVLFKIVPKKNKDSLP
jgi:hypothetical protein